jgi:HEAT repeat protein
VAVLIAGLQDKEFFVRVSACYGLMAIGPDGRDAVPALLKALRDKEPGVRANALAALEEFRLDAEALPALKQAALADDAFIRGKAIELRWRLDHDTRTAVAALTEMLKGKTARVMAAGVLGRMGEEAKDAALALTGALGDPQPPVRVKVAASLAQIGPAAKAALPALTVAVADSDPQVRLALAASIQRLGGKAEDALPVLLQAIREDKGDLRFHAQELLLRFGPAARAAVPVLQKLLTNQDPKVRLFTAATLSRVDPLHPEAAVDALLDLLPSAYGHTALDAAALLWDIDRHNPRALAVLVTALGDPDFGMRSHAAAAFVRLGPGAKAALPALLDALEDDSDLARVHAAAAVRKMDPGNAKGLAVLAGALKDRALTVTLRERAATYLGAGGPPGKDAVPVLLEALRGPIRSDRVAAAAALQKLDPEAAAKAGVPSR